MNANSHFTHTLLTHSHALAQALNEVPIEEYTNNFIVYNVLNYAWNGWEQYITQHAHASAHTLLLGINPGPHGMVQTGVPFGNISAVRDYLNLQPDIQKNNINTHPKRPVLGLDYKREEPSGKLLWGTIQSLYPRPQDFFSRFFVLNYCPLAFFTNDDKALNVTPDKLPKAYRNKIEALCSQHLTQFLTNLQTTHIFAIGKYTQHTAERLLQNNPTQSPIHIHYLTHPSPLNPHHKRFPQDFKKAVDMITQ